MIRTEIRKSFFDRWTEYIEKAGSRSHKYIRKIPNSKGKWYYIYPKDFKHPIKALETIFGLKEEKIDNAYEKNDINKLYGVTKESFAAHVLEYLSNRAKWNNFFSDKKTREAYKAPGKTTGGNKTKTSPTETKEKKEEKQEWNKSLMRKIYSMYNKISEDKNTPADNSLISAGDKVTMNGRTGIVQAIQDNGMGFVKFDDGGMGRFKLNDLQKINSETDAEKTQNRSEAMMGNDNAKKDGPTVIEDPIGVGFTYNYDGKTWEVVGFGPGDSPIIVSKDGERIEFDSMAEFDELYQNGEITNAAKNGINDDWSLPKGNKVAAPSGIDAKTIGGIKLDGNDYEYMIDKVQKIYEEIDTLNKTKGNSIEWNNKMFTAFMVNELKHNPGFMDAFVKMAAKYKIDNIENFLLGAKQEFDNLKNNGNIFETPVADRSRDLFDEKGHQIPLTYEDINEGLTEEERNQVYDEMRAEREADGYGGFDSDKFESYIMQWQNALREPTIKEQNKKLLKIFSILEDENWHTEDQMLLDGKFSDLFEEVNQMRTNETIWKEKNGILERIKDNKTVGKEYFDKLRANTSNSNTRAAIDEAEKQYNQDQEMARYRLESDRWDNYQTNYAKERNAYKLRDRLNTKEAVEAALNEELNGWNYTADNLHDAVVETDNFDVGRQARIDYLQEKLRGFNSTAKYGNTFPPSVAGNIPKNVSLDEVITKVGNSTVGDKVVDDLVKEKTGYNSLWDLQRSRGRDSAEMKQWDNVQEIVRLQTRLNQGLGVENGHVVTKVNDINGVPVKEGDVVRISNSYTQNENGLFRVKKLYDGSDGSTFYLQKVKKDGTDATSAYSGASWPMTSTYSSNPSYRAEYHKHNGKNGENVKIEVTQISDEARQKGVENTLKEKDYQFTSNGIRTPKGDYTSVYYTLGDDGSVHISSSGYGNTLGFLNTDTDKVRNDSDSMTDYFDKDDITVTPSNPYYKQIKRAALKNQISSMKKHLEEAKADIQKYSGSGKNYYNSEYYLNQAKEVVSSYPGKIAAYEKDLKAVEKELKSTTVKKSLPVAIIKNGRFLIRK